MTTNVDKNNGSNCFPYVISVLSSESSGLTPKNCKDKLEENLKKIVNALDYNTELYILTNRNSYTIVNDTVHNLKDKISKKKQQRNIIIQIWNKKQDSLSDYEYIAQHSHLMIVLGNKKIEDILNDDNNLKHTIQYKLEGYPGSEGQQVQSEKITYPAIGPVLFINNVHEYYFSSCQSITKEEKSAPKQPFPNSPSHKRILIENFENHIIDDKNNDITKRADFLNNLRILKKINLAIKSNEKKIKKKNKLENLSIKSLSIDQSCAKNQSDETPSNIQPLIKSCQIVNECAQKFKNRTNIFIHVFCGLLFLILICNAILIYLNDVCIKSTQTNAIQISKNYIERHWNNNGWSGFGKAVIKNELYPLEWFINNSISNESRTYSEIDAKTTKDDTEVKTDQNKTEAESKPKANKESNAAVEAKTEADAKSDNNDAVKAEAIRTLLSKIFIIFLSLLYINIVIIIILGLVYLYLTPHYLYHRFQTLADCMRVQAYWKYAGLSDDVSANFRAHQTQDIDWLRILLNGLDIQFNVPAHSIKDEKKIFSLLDKCWLEDRIINDFKPTLNNGFWNRMMEYFGYLISSLIILVIFTFLFLISIPIIKIIPCNLDILSSFITILFALVSLAIALVLLYKACILIYKLLIDLINTLEIVKSLISKNIPLLISFGIVVYFCFSGLFELIRLSSLSAPVNLSLFQEAEIDFGNANEIFRLVIQIIVAFILITFLYRKMQMLEKERRRIELLLPCFNVADYSIDIVLSDEEAMKRINTEHDNLIRTKVQGILNIIDNPKDLLVKDIELTPIKKIIDDLKNKQPQKVETSDFYILNPFTWSWPWKWRWSKLKNETISFVSDNNQNNKLDEIYCLLTKIKESKEDLYDEIIKQQSNKKKTEDEITVSFFCQQILLELGQEVLAKRIDWLIDVNDRDLKSPK